MYSESNKQIAAGRANDEFLRRMLGGELGGVAPIKNAMPQSYSALPDYSGNQTNCNGTRRQSNETVTPPTGGGCPTQIPAPALAMVYAPRQCWRELYTPAKGLQQGTLFAELDLPLEVVMKNCGTEVSCRK